MPLDTAFAEPMPDKLSDSADPPLAGRATVEPESLPEAPPPRNTAEPVRAASGGGVRDGGGVRSGGCGGT